MKKVLIPISKHTYHFIDRRPNVYISKKRLQHELDIICNRKSREDLPKLQILLDLEVINYEQYKVFRDYITDNQVSEE